MEKGNKERVFHVLQKITGKDYSYVDLDTDIEPEIKLDSIQFVEFYAALEKEFDVELPLNMMTVKSKLAFFRLLDEFLSKTEVK